MLFQFLKRAYAPESTKSFFVYHAGTILKTFRKSFSPSFIFLSSRFIPHGHEPNPPSRSLVRKDFPHIFEGKRVILSAGLIGPGKGYHYMIRAMVEVSKMCPNSVYVIAGDLHPGVVSSYLSDLHKLTKELKLDQWVKFVGGRNLGKEELLDWYSQSEIIVSPHLDPQQTSSGSVNMGMGFGKAVVASQFSFVQVLNLPAKSFYLFSIFRCLLPCCISVKY